MYFSDPAINYRIFLLFSPPRKLGSGLAAMKDTTQKTLQRPRKFKTSTELELALIQTHMTQKPQMKRAEEEWKITPMRRQASSTPSLHCRGSCFKIPGRWMQGRQGQRKGGSRAGSHSHAHRAFCAAPDRHTGRPPRAQGGGGLAIARSSFGR